MSYLTSYLKSVSSAVCYVDWISYFSALTDIQIFLLRSHNVSQRHFYWEPQFAYHIYDERQYNREAGAGGREQDEVDEKNVDNRVYDVES